MSKDWTEHFFINSQTLWEFFDTEVRDLELWAENPESKNGTVAAMIFAKRETLGRMMDFVRDHEDSLGRITERWRLTEREDD